MNDKKIDDYVNEIIKIEKEAINKRLNSINAKGGIQNSNKAEIEVVNKILSLLDKEDD